MPALGEDGSIYAVVKNSEGKKINIRIMELKKTSERKGGRNSLLLTDEGEEWLAKEIGSGSDVDDIARELGIAVTTLYTPANKAKTKRAVENGRGMVNNRLRKAQIKSALNGNSAMLIWLGKNRLGQTDQPKVDGNHALSQFAVDMGKAARKLTDSNTEGWEE